ncbi:helix-turn-helix domain-containing protein [Bradyrhizobium sp. UFLA05-153]
METVFSTEQVHPRDKFDFWHSVACKQIVDHDAQPLARSSFEAKIEAGEFGGLDVIVVNTSPMQISHAAKHISRTKSDYLFVCRQISGKVKLEQCSREVVLEQGCVTLLDPLLPYAGKFAQDCKMLVVKAPRRELEARLGRVRDVVACSVRPRRAQDRLTSSVMAMLPSLSKEKNSVSDKIVTSDLLDLIAVSITKTLGDDRPRVSSARALMLLNIRGVVEERLTDPALDAQAVADAVGISLRYANRILAELNTSLTRFILARRLARCRYALEDPTQAHRTVSEIAHAWGFSDLTNFGRRFKQAYRILPRDAREAAKRS